jgi:biotin carboxyl carrier protein
MALGREGGAIPIALVLLDGREIRLEWKQDGETVRFRVESEGEKTVDIREVGPGVYSLLIGGRSYDAHADGSSVSIAGRRFPVEVLDPRRWNRERNHHPAEGRQNIVATMPGKVVRVLVAVGDQVEIGQGIVVVEAMKMQNELKAAAAGRVVSMAAAPGATVNAGEILAAIE